MTKVLLDTDKAAVIEAFSGATVTDAGTPASDDKVLIQDTSDSDNLKYVNVSDLPGGGVDVLSNVATARIIGRTTAGSGDSDFSDDWITTEYNNQNSYSTFYSVAAVAGGSAAQAARRGAVMMM